LVAAIVAILLRVHANCPKIVGHLPLS